MKIKKVFSLYKAIQLKNMGNEILFSEPNWKRKGFSVFCFEDTLKLKKDWNSL